MTSECIEWYWNDIRMNRMTTEWWNRVRMNLDWWTSECVNSRGILVKMVIHQIWPKKNWKLHSVWFWCISDMVLYLLRWEKQGASLNFVPTHLFGKIQDFFVPGTYWQFLLKSHANAWISFARPWKSHYNLQIKHTNWKNAFAFKFSIRFDFFGQKVNW